MEELGQPAARAIPAGAFSRLPLPGAPGFAAGFTRGPLAVRSFDPDIAARVLAEALGTPDAQVLRLKQVHGRAVLIFEEPPRGRRNVVLGEGDVLLTRQPNVLLVVASADCVPIVLADAESGWLAAVHAGWRGTVARVIDEAVSALATRGVRPENLCAAFGPSISRDRYEVGPEVLQALLEAHRDVAIPEEAVRKGESGRAFVDVAAFNAAALRARGIRAEQMTPSNLCTHETQDLPSWRRDGAATGRILTGIVGLSP